MQRQTHLKANILHYRNLQGDERLDEVERQLLSKFVESLKVSAAVPHKLAIKTTASDEAAEICSLDEADSPYAAAFTHGSRQNSTIVSVPAVHSVYC